jgi:hypothetical protein
VTRQRVAQVVGILYLTTGREVTHEVIDAWAVALASTADGDDAIAVAAQLARSNEFPTLAKFYGALVASRRRCALELEQAARALPMGEDDRASLLSQRAGWAAFTAGARREAKRLGRPAPALPDEPPAGVSIAVVFAGMLRPPDRAESWNGGGDG